MIPPTGSLRAPRPVSAGQARRKLHSAAGIQRYSDGRCVPRRPSQTAASADRAGGRRFGTK